MDHLPPVKAKVRAKTLSAGLGGEVFAEIDGMEGVVVGHNSLVPQLSGYAGVCFPELAALRRPCILLIHHHYLELVARPECELAPAWEG